MDLNGKRLEAGLSIIGSILLRPEIVGEVVHSVRLTDFPAGEMRTIYGAVLELFGAMEPIDAVTVRGKLGAAYEGTLLRAMDATPTAANFRAYCRILKDSAKLAALQEAAAEIVTAPTLEDGLANAEKLSGLLGDDDRTEIRTWQESLANFVEAQTNHVEPKCYTLGITALDKRFRLEKGEYMVLAGRPSSGKTVLAAQLAWHISGSNRVGFFSFDQTATQLVNRLVAHAARIDHRKIRSYGLDDEDILEAVELGKKTDKRVFDIIENAALTTQQIQSIALSRHYDVIVIDYLQLINCPQVRDADRFQAVTVISLALKRIATTTGITVIALSQLSRPEKGRAGKRPTMADLRESGQIEQDANGILLLHRLDETDSNSARELIVAKQKDGGTGIIDLELSTPFMTFFPMIGGAKAV